ncbi:hypothetical protein [Vibrio vulnificus]|uniref:hypothetical protein n=1 Tax=Vibrio vulnificus TaxID=672 RepID=UPI001FAEC50E|nr:hypothetical protein [Vibrio vulnificus]MCJ0814284.1 hypothetical protein [Vibrio vulnificus]
MNQFNELPYIPKIEKNKLIILLTQKSARSVDFLKLFNKPRELYIFSILLHNEIVKQKNKENIEISIKELQNKYKMFRGESINDLMSYLNELPNDMFYSYNLDKENRYLSYNIKQEYFNYNEKTFFLNVTLLKGLKPNSQRILLFLMSMGPRAKYLHISHMATILGIENKSHKLKQKSTKAVIETLLKYKFIKSYTYNRNKKCFYINMENIQTTELLKSLDFDSF